MLPLEKPIKKIEYQTGELIPILTDVLRNTVVDVRCTDAAGKQFLVEMQLHWDESFKSRVLLNASKAYVMQLEKTEPVKLLKPVYALNFVNDAFEKSEEMKNEYYHHYKIVNIKNTEKQIEGLEFVFVELPKFKPENRAEKKLHQLWLRFLTEINESTKEVPKEMLKNKLICEAIGYMERSAYSKEDLDKYQQWKINSITATAMLENARAEGKAEGRAEGKAEGRAEGKAEGIEEGKAEGEAIANKKIIANGMKAGCSIEIMSTMTGLSAEDIKKIIKLIQEENEQ